MRELLAITNAISIQKQRIFIRWKLIRGNVLARSVVVRWINFRR